MSHYTHLITEEREMAMVMAAQGFSFRAIARKLNRSASTGHWESDTVLGQRKSGVIGTHVERKTGFLIAFSLDDRKNKAFNKAVRDFWQCA